MSSKRPFPPSSHSPSVSTSADDICGSGSLSGTKNPVVYMTPLTVEEVRKKTRTLLEEFLININYKVLVPTQSLS